MTTIPLQTVDVRLEADTVLARQRARQIAGLLGFPPLDQTRIATATSEIVRNAYEYAGGGKVEFLVENGSVPALLIRIRERGTGIDKRPLGLEGSYRSSTGLGIIGAKRLMDRFQVEESAGGDAVVTLAKLLPRSADRFGPRELAHLSAELARNAPKSLLEELQLQNQELLRALQELRERQTELARMHAKELDETNRGVVALYTELDENAKTLQRVSDLKTRFLSNMSHEFRSPLNTILSLCGFLLRRSDGDLTEEQEKQVHFIRKAADGLATLVNDLLDIAKVEAGKAVVRPAKFTMAELFENLQETIQPLLTQQHVTLVFEDASGIPPLRTDEAKVSQILRNFLSNAVKYTPSGEIRVSAALEADDMVVFTVSDTGIGIAPQDQALVFEEFVQVEGPLQGRIKGTGLGLPLSRKLAELLGGGVSLRSEVGVGSSFSAIIPRLHPDTAPPNTGRPAPAGKVAARPTAGALPTVLIIDDEENCRYILKGILSSLGRYAVLEASTGEAGLSLAQSARPGIVFLDLVLPGSSGLAILEQLRKIEATRGVPVVVYTSVALQAEDHARIAALASAIVSKAPDNRQTHIASIREALASAGLPVAALEVES